MISEEEKERLRAKDSLDDGRRAVMMDIDRMINEGMAGGRVNRDQIEGATAMPDEPEARLTADATGDLSLEEGFAGTSAREAAIRDEV